MAQTNITLSSKVIAITGANRGIGLGIAEFCLVNDAARVYSLDIGDTTDEFHALSQRFPDKLFAVHTDVTQESSISAAVDKIIDEAGALHARIAARAFIRLGIKGSTIFTASMASYRPNKRVPSAPYSASKAGICNMTHTLAMEWAPHDIRVNSVSPGLVNTAMTYWVPQQEDWEQQLKYYGGFPRLAEVQESGGAYVYLLSDAASYTTSIDIPVNGVIGSPMQCHIMPKWLPSKLGNRVLHSEEAAPSTFQPP
ncbi:uncharacterized protein ASPGLDRAFT_62599 [Aspergillus glaucus CBS 516.65]|uniref:Uncharacterized protein n=1 Tax=Aspergillus glaucus CBS 516.65 TaxID=1160497 RepID=A0A1L9VYL4_ASPGL|nr:hypothetical protein ASPGLDRAFT_62599 [Aspergillus glaucus CBS 516.65]OJJ88996.1 hypothetical protein ASPGLDRAFT_62599 [Aspergillus glaucus CBS 516.65]